MATVEKRNAYYKGMLAAKKKRSLSDIPFSMNMECKVMWIAGFNAETEKRMRLESERAMMADML